MAERSDLTETLAATLRRGDPAVNWLQPGLLRLVAGGQPVAVADIAAASGPPQDEVQAALAQLPDTELDEVGRVVGWGITQRPTPHQFDVAGRRLFTWCALDTLMFPALLGEGASVSSPCHATGEPIHVRVDVDPDRITASHPTAPSCRSSRPVRPRASAGPSATRSISSPAPTPPVGGWPSTRTAASCRWRKRSSSAAR